MMIFQSSNPQPTTPQQSTPNPRALAQLFKLDLADYFNQWNEDKPLRTGFPHASAILAPESSFCLRQLVLLATQPERAERPEQKPWDSHTNAVFLNGWTLHEKYQKLIKLFGSVIEVEESHFDETRLLHFTPDAIVWHMGHKMVIEIKGYKQSHFEKLNESGGPPGDAHKQANFYCHLLQIQYGLILVENKDTQEYKVWCVEYSKELTQPYIDRLYHFKAAYSKAGRTGELPARCCKHAGESRAQKCPMRAYCFKEK